jgi:hypothetical protein
LAWDISNSYSYAVFLHQQVAIVQQRIHIGDETTIEETTFKGIIVKNDIQASVLPYGTVMGDAGDDVTVIRYGFTLDGSIRHIC